MLEARALTCKRGDATLFSDLSFALPEGNALLVRGANGSGKTSLLRILAGLATAHAGELSWQGATLKPLHPGFRAQTVYLGHQAPLKDDLSVIENLEFALRLDGVAVDREQLLVALNEVGLASRRMLPARQLSQGQRRRIGLARLKLNRRKLWLLDEPLTALDAAGMSLFQERLDAHLAAGGLAVVSTHQDFGARPTHRELALQ
jgi:heme exporter protein A